MSATVIMLLIIGVVCIVLSYVISEGLSEKKDEPEAIRYQAITDEYELTDAEKRVIRGKISEAIADYADHIVNATAEELSKQTNEKMLALGDYAVSVCDEIENNHKEVMFLYSMLNDKQKEIIDLVNNVDVVKQELNKSIEKIDIEHITSNVKNATEDKPSTSKIVEIQKDVEVTPYDTAAYEDSSVNEITDSQDFEDDFKEIDAMDVDLDSIVDDDVEEENINGIILELHKSGMNIIEIAKQLGLGVGEVKLVVDLYQGE